MGSISHSTGITLCGVTEVPYPRARRGTFVFSSGTKGQPLGVRDVHVKPSESASTSNPLNRKHKKIMA